MISHLNHQQNNSLARKLIQPLDGWLVSIILILFILSMFLLYSAANDTPEKMVNKIIYSGLSFAIMWILAAIPPDRIMRFSPLFYIIGVILLLGVTLFGKTVNGSQRWLDLGITRIQPSEIMKLALPMMIAYYFHRLEHAHSWFHYIIASLLIAVPGILILKQPDLGTALLIMASGFFVLYYAGLSWKVMIGGASLLAISIPFIIWPMMHDYQKRRVLTLLDPSQDPLGAGYHIIQSTIAIGSGGTYGKGWLNGTQTHLDFIPERSTDFIFAVYAEEFGLLGNIILLFLYGVLLIRGLIIAHQSESLYGRLMAGSITLTFFMYAFVNMGMVSGILPVVGVPLPLMSYGGTATLTLMAGLGMLMGIEHNRRHLGHMR
jgi:rod shape determining protein RodA